MSAHRSLPLSHPNLLCLVIVELNSRRLLSAYSVLVLLTDLIQFHKSRQVFLNKYLRVPLVFHITAARNLKIDFNFRFGFSGCEFFVQGYSYIFTFLIFTAIALKK